MKPVSLHHRALLLSLALFTTGAALAQTSPATVTNQNSVRTETQERIYREDLMSEQERLRYLERLRLARSEDERERIRLEHQERMDLRLRAIGQAQSSTPVQTQNRILQGTGAPVIIKKRGR